MSKDLVFYTNPMSRGRIVRWMLEEVGRPYRTEIMEYGTTMKSPEYLAIHPLGKVPAVKHGDTVVTETAAICAYLADAFPKAGLAPARNDPARGAYYRWLFFTAGPLEAAATDKALGVVVPDDKRGTVGYGSLAAVLDTIDGQLQGADYVAGESFTAADVLLASHIGWGMAFGTFESRPSFQAYVERTQSRPAAIRARAIDDSLVAQRAAS